MAFLPPSERVPAGRSFEIASTGVLICIAALAGALSMGWLPRVEQIAADQLVVEAGALHAIANAAQSAVPEAEPPTSSQPPAEAQPAPPEPGYAVPRTTTPLDEVSIARILRKAHELEFGEPPSDLRLAVAWAHIALENKRGEAIECNNFGNLSVWEREPGPHFIRIMKERRRASYNAKYGRWRWVEMRFRAFEGPMDGARAYWRHLRDHYSLALALFTRGDGHDAGMKLARDGYATAYPQPYADSVSRLALECRSRILPQL